MAESQGWFTRMWRKVFGRRPAEPTPPEPAPPAAPSVEVAYEPPDTAETLAVPALGDVFQFHLIPHFRWSSTQMNTATLAERAVLYADQARTTLLHRVWATARTLDPQSPAIAERTINDSKEMREGWCYPDEKGTIQCSPSVRVMIDRRLHDQRLPFMTRELDMNEAHRLGLLRADHVLRLTERWLQVVKELEQLQVLGRDERQFLVPLVSRLADEGFAAVMGDMAGSRFVRAQQLANVLAQARAGHEQFGLFEFANAYDKALQTFCRQMGISPFAWAMSDFGGPEQVQEVDE